MINKTPKPKAHNILLFKKRTSRMSSIRIVVLGYEGMDITITITSYETKLYNIINYCN